jgi:hypothetical protein
VGDECAQQGGLPDAGVSGYQENSAGTASRAGERRVKRRQLQASPHQLRREQPALVALRCGRFANSAGAAHRHRILAAAMKRATQRHGRRIADGR